MKMQCMRRVLLVSLVLVVAGGGACAEPNGLVVMLTDYGADSIYVGILKGSMYTKWPEVRIDTLTNSVPSFDIEAGAAFLAEACREFPEGTTFCCVVDPGVGTTRKCVAVETNAGQFFVAPDNGLLTAVVERDGIRQMREASNRRYWRDGVVSSTFHGRDIFGPVSASVAGGAVLRTLGSPVKKLLKIDIPKPGVVDGVAMGRVRRVDPYGNVITDITRGMLQELGIGIGEMARVTVGDYEVEAPYGETYASVEQGDPVLLIQSMDVVECAINRGSMAKASGATFHAPVTIKKVPVRKDAVLASLTVEDESTPDFSVTVYPDGHGNMKRGVIEREFKLAPGPLDDLKRTVARAREGLAGISVPLPGQAAVRLGMGIGFYPFERAEDIPDALRPVEAALRAIYEKQVSELVRPEGAQ